MKTPQRIDAVIEGILHQTKDRQGALFALQRSWGKLVGGPLAAHTRPASLRRGRLIVHADRPGDGFQFRYQQAELLARLRRAVREPIEELVIRPGPNRNTRRATSEASK